MNRIIASSRVYVDANAFIYYFEGNEKFIKQAHKIFSHIAHIGGYIVTNEIAIAECLYHPSKMNNEPLITAYEELFQDIELLPLTGELAITASLEGGRIGLKLIDAIHYISALEGRCDFFLTADKKIASVSHIPVILLADD